MSSFALLIAMGVLGACGGSAAAVPSTSGDSSESGAGAVASSPLLTAGGLRADFVTFTLTFEGGFGFALQGGDCDVRGFSNTFRFERSTSTLSWSRCVESDVMLGTLRQGSRPLVSAEDERVVSAYATIAPMAPKGVIGCGTDAPIVLLDVEAAQGLRQYVSYESQCFEPDRTVAESPGMWGLMELLDQLSL